LKHQASLLSIGFIEMRDFVPRHGCRLFMPWLHRHALARAP